LILSLAFSILVTIKLFKVTIKLPKELEDELKKIEKWIRAFKWMSLVLSILIFLKLAYTRCSDYIKILETNGLITKTKEGKNVRVSSNVKISKNGIEF